ncbi:MAG: DNA-protecting protein DprA [Candidatus Moranbacteria bacterium]|nr:DNA-protecting protein DprA [Candidatus Moranbacteria bacterium]
MKMSKDLKYWLAINKIDGIGPLNFKKLYKHFNTMDQVWKANKSTLIKSGLSEKLIIKFLDQKNKICPDKELSDLKKYQIQAISIKNDLYPNLLKQIYDPPPVLYFKGCLPKNTDLTLSVVGSRDYSDYGKTVCQKLIKDLMDYKIKIISGLAIGIDTIAHQECLKSFNQTFAVLGCGLNQIYPSSNYNLAQKIINYGGLISEHPPTADPFKKQNFHARNRIISGLSRGVLIIEAKEKSGSLISANHGLTQNREVFAVPGSIFSLKSKGSHKLIQQGAKLIDDFKDILEELNIRPKNPKKNKFLESKIQLLNPLQQKIIKEIKDDIKNFEKLKRALNLDSSKLLSNLTELEISGLIINRQGNYYFNKNP